MSNNRKSMLLAVAAIPLALGACGGVGRQRSRGAPLPSPERPTGSSVRDGQLRGKVAQQPDPHTNRRAKPGRSEDQLAGLG